MAPVNIKFVVSFSSQDENHCIQNITKSSGFKKWLSHPKDKSGKIEAVFQLETECIISYIDVGSVWCAMFEVQVGRSDWPQDRTFSTLIPTCSLMTPADCRLGRSYTKTRMFGPNDFSSDVAGEKWDRVKIICRQPFRKDVQYGLSFFHIKSNCANPSTGSHPQEIPTGQKSVKSIQKHFFGKSSTRKENPDGLKSKLLRIAGSSENGTEQAASLTRTAKLVLAATDQGKAVNKLASQGSPNNRPAMYSSHIQQKYGPQFEEEVSSFLDTVDVNENELDNITFADLRHKFEKKKKRKLTTDEKKVFFKRAKEFICSQFGKKSGTDSNIESEEILDPPVKNQQRGAGTNLNILASKSKGYAQNQENKMCTRVEDHYKSKTLNYGSGSPCEREKGDQAFTERLVDCDDSRLKSRKVVTCNMTSVSPFRKHSTEISPIVDRERGNSLNDKWLSTVSSKEVPQNGKREIIVRKSKKRSNSSLSPSANQHRGAKACKQGRYEGEITGDSCSQLKNARRGGNNRGGGRQRSREETLSFQSCSLCGEDSPASHFNADLKMCVQCSSPFEVDFSLRLPWEMSSSTDNSDRTSYTEYEIDTPDSFVECPICSEIFSSEAIEVHAAMCGET